MNIAKNMEAIFIAAVALATFIAYAAAPAPTLRALDSAVAVSGKMAVVVITGKRLSAEEKVKLAA